MENAKLIELRRAYKTELIAGRYSSAEQVCWDALEMCGFHGPHRKFSYWLTSAGLKEGTRQEAVWLWQWACLLADIYYELGKYTEAEPVYAGLVVVWMAWPLEVKGQASETRALLPDLLRKLAGAEAFVGKEWRAGKHWVLAKVLSGKRISIQTVDEATSATGSIASSVAGVKRMLPKERHSRGSFRRGESFTRRGRLRRR